MNWLLIVFALVLLWRVVEGCKRGMVKEIISFVSLVVLCVAGALLGSALTNYFEQDVISMVVAIVLLLALCIAHRILSLFFFSAKLVSKLPVIHSLDKLLGIVIGALETVLLIWTVYTLLVTVDTGEIGEQILAYVQSSKILTFFYEHNMLAGLVEAVMDKIVMLPI
ncbi:MAG: CvpA family protein [Lachnospiraceae bacterium]|nr:CvpA family protein [Lachnospiraceae bacterium]